MGDPADEARPILSPRPLFLVSQSAVLGPKRGGEATGAERRRRILRPGKRPPVPVSDASFLYIKFLLLFFRNSKNSLKICIFHIVSACCICCLFAHNLHVILTDSIIHSLRTKGPKNSRFCQILFVPDSKKLSLPQSGIHHRLSRATKSLAHPNKAGGGYPFLFLPPPNSRIYLQQKNFVFERCPRPNSNPHFTSQLSIRGLVPSSYPIKDQRVKSWAIPAASNHASKQAHLSFEAKVPGLPPEVEVAFQSNEPIFCCGDFQFRCS